MTKKEDLIKIINLCKEALESCGDNYGSEASDNGDYTAHFDENLVTEALRKIGELKLK